MRVFRPSVLGAFTAVAASFGTPAAVRGQSPAATARTRTPVSTSATLRTSWGAPDLEGTWDFRTVTPMERPPELAGKQTLTEKEAAEYEQRIVEQRNADTHHATTRRRTVNGTAETEDVALA